MKISKAQQDVLDAMANGWELGKYSGNRSSIRLQKGGMGRGGETKGVSVATFVVLIRNKLIVEGQRGFPLTKYVLANKGKTA